ncbi:hypothetical protein SAMN05421676_106104 [Salinibacillus kushneri]|uniref:Uncharacterized protein n=1 Tax=Salinibacillus kushneri TaxID=237682 RepID=A0A1I0FUY8_9BACI|nr:hypothetical protein SAMN05421676_106104 [Salinibacillus kushneri]
MSDELVQLQFPFRDYQTLAKIAIESLIHLGEAGKQALYETGRKFGSHIIKTNYPNESEVNLTNEEKIRFLKETSAMLGLDPDFSYDETHQVMMLKIFHCPFKELAFSNENQTICEMHRYFISGMFEQLFTSATLKEETNMLNGCQTCMYKASIQ